MIPPEGKFLQSSLKLFSTPTPLRTVALGGGLLDFSHTTLLASWSELDCHGLSLITKLSQLFALFARSVLLGRHRAKVEPVIDCANEGNRMIISAKVAETKRVTLLLLITLIA